MIVTHKLQTMDLAHKQNTIRVDVVQDDKYSRNLEFALTVNGSPWEIPAGTTAAVRYKKPDGTGGNYDAMPDGSTAYQINGNILTVALAPQVCTVSGDVQLAVGLIQGSAEINTFSVNIVVHPNPGAAYQSEDYIKLSGAVPNSGWTSNMYLGTDSSGNVVAKEGTSGGGGTVSVDSTLTKSGQAADAEVVGNRLSALSEEIVTTSESKVSAHNTGTDTHSDIRVLIQGLTDRLNALADSDDTTLDQLSEVVAYIKSNRSLIEAITTSKVSVEDIVDNMTTNVANKPLSAAQGVALKALIDAISVPDTLPNPNALTFTGAVNATYDGSAPLEVAIPSGGDAGKRVRHIATVSVTEGTTSYDVTVDSNGDALNLESVYIFTNKFWGSNGSYIQIAINRKELTRAYGQSGSPQVLELEKMGELQKFTNIPKPSDVGISFGDYYNGKSAVTSVGFWSPASTVNTTIEIYGVDA